VGLQLLLVLADAPLVLHVLAVAPLVLPLFVVLFAPAVAVVV
jgi:hypothetical protein